MLNNLRKLARKKALLPAPLLLLLAAQCAPAPPPPPTGVGSCYTHTGPVTAVSYCSAAAENGFHRFRDEAVWEVGTIPGSLPAGVVTPPPYTLRTSGPMADPPDRDPNVPQLSRVESKAPAPDLTYVASQGYNTYRLVSHRPALYN